MEYKQQPGFSFLDHLQSGWYAGDRIDVAGIRQLLDQFGRTLGGLVHTLPVFYIIDYTEQRYLLMTDQLLPISGYHPREFLETRLDKLLSVFHKDDFRVYNKEVFARNTSFLAGQAPEERSNFLFSYNFRFEGSDRRYVHVLQRNCYVTDTETGLPLYGIGALTDITSFKSDDVIVHTIEDCGGERRLVEQNFFYPDEERAQLSEREKDVLLYLADGHSSKEIADRLGISQNTVNNHRQNMLRKTNTRNIAHLVAFALRNRII